MRFITGTKVFNGTTFLATDTVLILNSNGTLNDIQPSAHINPHNIETFEGIITPGFINAHCHLELSHLKNKIPQQTGLPNFAKHIMLQRKQCSVEDIEQAMLQADLFMKDKGIVAVGDISNGPDSFSCKKNSSIYYHTFIEVLGLNPQNHKRIFNEGLGLYQTLKNEGLPGSLAPHAPYSSSLELISNIANFDAEQNLPFSIHNQESLEETKFFKGEINGFNELFKFLNLDISWFIAPKTSSLKHYSKVLAKGPSLLVHNTFTSADDIASVNSNNTFWCFCPQANLYIENKLPDYTAFKNYADTMCIGTDSLASNNHLDVISECNTLLLNSTTFSIPQLLKAITYNGARALGIELHYGSLIKEKNTGLNLIRENNSQLQFIKKII